MKTLYVIVIRCVIALACALPLAGCGQDLPLPEGVNKDAKPQIIVKQGDIFIDGQKINVRKSGAKDWVAILGESSFTRDHFRHWDMHGLTLSTPMDDEGRRPVDVLGLYLRRDDQWERMFRHDYSGLKNDRPTGTFKGYLEIDGIPIGPNMKREEIERWRKKLGQERLGVDRDLGYYRAGEDHKWAQHYYFDGDGPLIYIEFL
ncbi:LptM family lipoprotein [Roseateles koreensis]|uniref:DUF7738 domain-containing protein n=1 Tax=Roseateles koreensis TaxID=2987526 RepID=A0ABT5KWT1_9BURK|nr:hypothetical protein [Roseateles koreensis]MDC8787261.1 hypothetical protein [Roseateles koreensis]